MKTTNTVMMMLATMVVAGCVGYGPSRYDGYDQVTRSARELESASADYYEQVRRDVGYDGATRDAGELVLEAQNFRRQVEAREAGYEFMRQDFKELAEAYALAQNELATRPDLSRNPRIADEFRDVEAAFAKLNDAIDYSSGHYYDREGEVVGYREPRR